ncbi:MAG: DUF2490 domain-containing protein [Candidatus Obscuribacterales bacterium]|nr:DUF2490 domain-containing protein [Candidatus Obscuribacterales bacterium]
MMKGVPVALRRLSTISAAAALLVAFSALTIGHEAVAQTAATGGSRSLLGQLTRQRLGPPVEIDNDFGMWTPVFLQYPITRNRKLQIYQEVQPRFTSDMDRFEQLLLRQNLLYVINKRSDVQVGYVFTRTYFPTRVDDHRVSQQYAISIPIRKLAFYNRFRLEERFIEYRDGEVSVRARYNSRFTYPVYRDRVFAFVSNELFVNLNRVNRGPTPGLDQNRLLVGTGVRVYKQLRFDVGYMNQYLNLNGNRDKMNHILWIGTSQNF